MTLKKFKPHPNVYARNCFRCGLRVEAGKGVAKQIEGPLKKKSITLHIECDKKL